MLHLPAVVPLSTFGLTVQDLARWPDDGPVTSPKGGFLTRQRGHGRPPMGERLIRDLLPKVRKLLSEPGLEVANSYGWTGDREMHVVRPHTDREGLDVTLHFPAAPAGGWNLHLRDRRVAGGEFVWDGTPGSVLISDGRVRMHWRPLQVIGPTSVLLLHYTRPHGVLERRGLLSADEISAILDTGEGLTFSAGATTDGKDGRRLSDERKALASSYREPATLRKFDDLARDLHPDLKPLRYLNVLRSDVGMRHHWQLDSSGDPEAAPIDPRQITTVALLETAEAGGVFEIKGYGALEGEPGDAWAFPSKTARHRVTEVTRGRRQSLVGWHHRLDGDQFTEPGSFGF